MLDAEMQLSYCLMQSSNQSKLCLVTFLGHSCDENGVVQVQANLGMKRCKQCEELLALASWLLYSDPKHAVPLMKAQLSRLYGQLHALMGRWTFYTNLLPVCKIYRGQVLVHS